MADYAGLDYDRLAQAYMRLLEERGPGYRGIPFEGAAYQSKDPGGTRWKSGELDPDVGWLDPVALLAGAVSAGSSRLLPAARQLRTWYHGYDPARVKELMAQRERESWIEILKSIERDKGTAVRPMLELPAKPPTSAPTFPMEGDADLWLAERLRDLTRWRTGEDDVMSAVQNAIPEFDVSMDQVAKNMIADALRVSGGRSAPHPYLNDRIWPAPPWQPPPDYPTRTTVPVPADPLPWPPPLRRTLPVPEVPSAQPPPGRPAPFTQIPTRYPMSETTRDPQELILL